MVSHYNCSTGLRSILVRGQRGWLRHWTDHHKCQLEHPSARIDQPSVRLREPPVLLLGVAAARARRKTNAALAPLDDDRRAEAYGAQGPIGNGRGTGRAHRRGCPRLSGRRRRRDRRGTQVRARTSRAGGHCLRGILQGSEGDIRVACPSLVMTYVLCCTSAMNGMYFCCFLVYLTLII